MRRIAALLVGLVLVAGTVEAQAVKCTQSKTTRLKDKGAQFVNGVMKSWYVSSDSVATTCSGFPAARVDTVTVPGPVVHDTVYVPKPDSVKPPVDTVKPPPVDTTPRPTPVGVLFSSDWRAATGTSTAALTDGGKWTNTWEPCPPAPIDIIPNPGTFPAGMKNVVRVRNGNNGNCQWIQGHSLWPLPAIGKSVAFRVYLRSEIPDAVGSKTWANLHPMESGYNSGTGGGFWEWKMGNNTNGTFPLTFETRELDLTFGPSDGTGPAGVKKFETWRLEWKFTRTAAGRYGLDVRIYDHTDKLVYDKTNTYMAWGRNQALANAGSNFAIDDAQIQQARIGINGGDSMSGTPYVYWGGFAVCTDWCGAY